MFGIIFLNVQPERLISQVIDRRVPCDPVIVGLNVPVVKFVGVDPRLNNCRKVHGLVRYCQASNVELSVPERICAGLVRLSVFNALH